MLFFIDHTRAQRPYYPKRQACKVRRSILRRPLCPQADISPFYGESPPKGEPLNESVRSVCSRGDIFGVCFGKRNPLSRPTATALPEGEPLNESSRNISVTLEHHHQSNIQTALGSSYLTQGRLGYVECLSHAGVVSRAARP